jgi:chorismate mutase
MEELVMKIEDPREELDLIDNELLRLLNMRARAFKAGDEAQAPAGDAEAALERACRANAGPLGEQAVARIFRRIVRETRRAGRRPRRGCAWLEESRHEEVGELV